MLYLPSLFLAACAGAPAHPPSALDPHGPAAAQIAQLWWVMFGLGTLIWVGVMACLAWALFRRRPRHAKREPRPASRTAEHGGGQDTLPGGSTAWIGAGGVAMPLLVLTGLFVFSLSVTRSLGDMQPAAGMIVEVNGYQWWWEVRYPNQQVVTANEIHIPVGQPVELKLTSADVIHSLWVPELHGKLDLIPGRTNSLVLQADQPGEYRGQCAEFCGVQHTNMALLIIAETPENFAAWIARQKEPASDPTVALARRGQQVFLGSACVYCHTVRGTNAGGKLGPDLTHLASRRTLAAVTTPNTRGHLAGWLIDPQAIKPGNRMPPTDLSAEELQALLAYLETLK